MILEYVQAGLRGARYEILPEDGSYYGEIPGCAGVYATAGTLEACREELREVLKEWLLVRVHRNLPLPVLDGIAPDIQEDWQKASMERVRGVSDGGRVAWAKSAVRPAGPASSAAE